MRGFPSFFVFQNKKVSRYVQCQVKNNYQLFVNGTYGGRRAKAAQWSSSSNSNSSSTLPAAAAAAAVIGAHCQQQQQQQQHTASSSNSSTMPAAAAAAAAHCQQQKQAFPALLLNANCHQQTSINRKNYSEWQTPHKKKVMQPET